MFFFFTHSTKIDQLVSGLISPTFCPQCKNFTYFLLVELWKNKTAYWIFNYSSQYVDQYVACTICDAKYEAQQFNDKISLRGSAEVSNFLNFCAELFKTFDTVLDVFLKEWVTSLIENTVFKDIKNFNAELLFKSLFEKAMDKTDINMVPYKNHKEYNNMVRIMWFRVSKLIESSRLASLQKA